MLRDLYSRSVCYLVSVNYIGKVYPTRAGLYVCTRGLYKRIPTQDLCTYQSYIT